MDPKNPQWSDLVFEITGKDMRRNTDPKSKARSKKLPFGSIYQSTDLDGVVTITTHSQFFDRNGLIYTQRIQMVDWPTARDMTEFSVKYRVNLALSGDLKCECTCPAFLYWGYRYINTQLDSVYGDPEDREPKIRNPHLNGIVCKHLYNALLILPFNNNRIARDLMAQGVK